MSKYKVNFDESHVDFENTWLERDMDDAPVTAAHPDTSVIFVGPPRLNDVQAKDSLPYEYLSIIGFVQNISFNENAMSQFVPCVGTSRKYPIKGSTNSGFNIGRLVFNHDNLIKAIYTNFAMRAYGEPDFIKDGKDFNKLPDKDFKELFKGIAPNGDLNSNFWMDMSNPLTYVPFGLGVVSRNKRKDAVGGVYAEHCMFSSFSFSTSAGSGSIAENITGVCDRLMPFNLITQDQKLKGDFWGKVEKMWTASEEIK